MQLSYTCLVCGLMVLVTFPMIMLALNPTQLNQTDINTINTTTSNVTTLNYSVKNWNPKQSLAHNLLVTLDPHAGALGGSVLSFHTNDRVCNMSGYECKIVLRHPSSKRSKNGKKLVSH